MNLESENFDREINEAEARLYLGMLRCEEGERVKDGSLLEIGAWAVFEGFICREIEEWCETGM